MDQMVYLMRKVPQRSASALVELAQGEEPAPALQRGRGRPRRDPADAEVRQRLMRAGLEHLTERGYSAVGLNEILAMADAPKGCFYHYFRGKDDFAAQLIDAYDAYFTGRLKRCFGDPALSPLRQLRDFIAAAERGMAKHHYRRGCLIGNLGQEMGALPEVLRARLIAVLEGWQARTADCLRAAQAAGELEPHHDPAALAVFFWTGWEGAVLRAKLERSGAPLTGFATTFFGLLGARTSL